MHLAQLPAATKRKTADARSADSLYAQGKESLGDQIEKDETADEQRVACKCNF